MFFQIPIQILDTLKPSRGSVVLDPFCGSGTVLVEALIRNHTAIGIDTNPIARLITQAKTTSLDKDLLSSTLTSILANARPLRRVAPRNRLPPYWFTQPARNALYRLYCAITELPLQPDYRTFFLANLTSILRACSLADPAIPPPVRMQPERLAIAGPRYRRAFENATQMTSQTVYRKFANVSLRNIERLSQFSDHASMRATLLDGSALNMKLPDNTVDIVITSPPYCGAQKYIRSFRLELLLMGYNNTALRTLDRETLGAERTLWTAETPSSALTNDQLRALSSIASRNPSRARMLHIYLHKLDIFANDLKRVLKPDGHAFLTFGISHFAGIPVNIADCFAEFSSRAGLDVVARMSDQIPSRRMITKRSNSAAVIQSEEVLWLRRPR